MGKLGPLKKVNQYKIPIFVFFHLFFMINSVKLWNRIYFTKKVEMVLHKYTREDKYILCEGEFFIYNRLYSGLGIILNS